MRTIAPVEGINRNRPAVKIAGSRVKRDTRRKNLTVAQRRTAAKAKLIRALIARNVRIVRTAHGWSQLKLAEMLGWDRSTIIRLESGRFCPSADQLGVLAELMDLDPGQLFQEMDPFFAAANAGTVPELLRSIRLQRDLSQFAVADHCGIPRHEYRAIESGHRAPTPRELSLLSAVLREDLRKRIRALGDRQAS